MVLWGAEGTPENYQALSASSGRPSTCTHTHARTQSGLNVEHRVLSALSTHTKPNTNQCHDLSQPQNGLGLSSPLHPPCKWSLPPIGCDRPVSFVSLWHWFCLHMELPQRMQHGNSSWPSTPLEAGCRASRGAKHLCSVDACHLLTVPSKGWTGSSELTFLLWI